jgi:hypothetical protein
MAGRRRSTGGLFLEIKGRILLFLLGLLQRHPAVLDDSAGQYEEKNLQAGKISLVIAGH